MNQKESQELTKIFWRYLWSSILISLSASIGTIVNGIIVGNLIGESGVSAINLVEEFPNVLVTRSFSKGWGMAGLRLGYGVTSTKTDLLQQLQKEIQSHCLLMQLQFLQVRELLQKHL